MKKLFISFLAVAVCASAMAASTAAVRIKLVGSNPTYAVNTLYLNEDDARNSTYESGYDAESMMTLSNSYSVLIYADVEGHSCERVATNNLDGLHIGFTTNNVDADYSLQFSNFSGRELKLYDAVLDSVITINASTPAYAFTATAGQIAVTDRFSIGEPAPVAYEICHRYNALQVSGYKGGTVVVKDNTDATVISVVVPTRTQHTIDLSALAAGQYKVEANGQTLIIDVK